MAVVARLTVALLCVSACACGRNTPAGAGRAPVRPSILLVTLDTTRADSIGPEAPAVSTPVFNALAARGRRFRQAYAAAPETLPSHLSMLSGLYPAGHGVHENGRTPAGASPMLAERMKAAGYRTAAFVSSFVLAKRFGAARGFDLYDDDLPAGAVERRATETTDRAIAHLREPGPQPRLVWVHYFDPHAPYAAPEPYRTRHPQKPYLGEVEYVDAELGRLLTAFEQAVARDQGTAAVIVAADHGEGLGDHGEFQHGNLLYQSTMHVPLLVAGPGVSAGVEDAPVSTRRIFHTVLDWAGLGAADSLRAASSEVVLGEAMKPYLNYGWQPQIMAVLGPHKAIFAGRLETYDLRSDPAERNNLGAGASLPPAMRKALDDYPVPPIGGARKPEPLSDEARRNLASLGYVSGGASPVVRKDAPRPVDMAALFPVVDAASTLFVQERYAEAIPLFEKVLAQDPHNLDAALRLATAQSSLGREPQAIAAFRRAAAIAPASDDVRLYLALHYARGRDWQRAIPILQRIVDEQPDRLVAVERLADLRQKQGWLLDALTLRQRVHALRPATGAELVALGQLAMQAGETNAAIAAFERARQTLGGTFESDLELGVLLLAARRFPEARDALDRVAPTHSDYPMALFKRAQVSVLLNEPDASARIELARRRANAITKALIEREALFRQRR